MNKHLVFILLFVYSSLYAQRNFDAYSFLSSLSHARITSKTEAQEIKKICRALRKQYHPDKNIDKSPQEQETANKLYIDINSACATIFSSDSYVQPKINPPKATYKHSTFHIFEYSKNYKKEQTKQDLTKAPEYNSSWYAYIKRSYRQIDSVVLFGALGLFIVLNRRPAQNQV